MQVQEQNEPHKRATQRDKDLARRDTSRRRWQRLAKQGSTRSRSRKCAQPPHCQFTTLRTLLEFVLNRGGASEVHPPSNRAWHPAVRCAGDARHVLSAVCCCSGPKTGNASSEDAGPLARVSWRWDGKTQKARRRSRRPCVALARVAVLLQSTNLLCLRCTRVGSTTAPSPAACAMKSHAQRHVVATSVA